MLEIRENGWKKKMTEGLSKHTTQYACFKLQDINIICIEDLDIDSD